MKQSRYFLKTSKTFSEEDTITSARLLKQAGYIAESVAGRYFFLPAGQRVQAKIMKVVKEEMDKNGAQEMLAPVLHPLELWKETNRARTTGFELMKVKDRRGSLFALGGTAEEMFVDLVRSYEISYKDLPFQLYQFSTKFRDELRARGGLLRVREFIMKDGYSFHRDEQDFKREYEKMKKVYTNIFSRLGLQTVIVESDNGYIGGEYCHEFIVDSEIGESRYFATAEGDYAAHEDVAKFKKLSVNAEDAPKKLQKVAAERGKTMEDGAKLHALPLERQIKDVLFVDDGGRLVLAIIRGDLEVNEAKLKHVLGSNALRHATDEEVLADIDSFPGFISPVGIRDRVKSAKQLVVIADDSLSGVRNMYGGANERNVDLLNVDYDRDIRSQIDKQADIAMARPGDLSESGSPLIEKRGIEVGNIFQLGYHYTSLMKGATFTDSDGKGKPYYMGCYGIGIGRTLAAIVEKYHDDKGIMWPETAAPFGVHLLALDVSNPQVLAKAEALYLSLQAMKVEVLFDDRDVSAGMKFADCDLIGIPYRVVVSAKTVAENSFEIRKREQKKTRLVAFEKYTEIFK